MVYRRDGLALEMVQRRYMVYGGEIQCRWAERWFCVEMVWRSDGLARRWYQSWLSVEMVWRSDG
jgi:hypothetical protein